MASLIPGTLKLDSVLSLFKCYSSVNIGWLVISISFRLKVDASLGVKVEGRLSLASKPTFLSSDTKQVHNQKYKFAVTLSL